MAGGGGRGGEGVVSEHDPLTWTWMHSSPMLDRGDGIPLEGWSTWAGPACKTEVDGVSQSSGVVDQTQLTANPPALILHSSTQIPCL